MNRLPKTRILLVEDDEKLSRLMKEFLEAQKEFLVTIEPRGDTAVQRILKEKPDLVVLDIMLPGLDGLAICKEIRPHYKEPILMLTALGEEVDQVVGLEIGADDYVAKPVSPRLLLARIRTLLRRATGDSADSGKDEVSVRNHDTDNQRIELGELVIEAASRAATLNGRELDLTTAEFDLLWLLARHAGEVLTREAIYKELRGIEWDGLDRSIDIRVTRLRKKMSDDGKSPRWIKSVRGTGYILAVNS